MKNSDWMGKPHALANENANFWMGLPTPEVHWKNSNMVMFLTMLGQSSSLFVPLFLVLLSVIEMDRNGLLYIATLTVCTFLYKFFTNQVVTDPSKRTDSAKHHARANPACRMFTLPALQNTNFENQSVSTFILVFTLTYIMSPMVELGKYNYAFIFTLLVLILLDICWKVYSSCTSFLGVLTGMLMGGLTGFVAWLFLKRWNDGTYVYHFDRRNDGRTTCKVQGDVKYTCDFEDEEDEVHIAG